jgi:hypothetical protein
MFTDVSPGWGVLNAAIAAGAGLVGVSIGAWMTGRNQKAERRNARTKEKLQDFYSPMLGMRSEIKAKSESRFQVTNVAGGAWVEEFVGVTDPDAKRTITEAMSPKYDRVQNYNEVLLKEQIVPLYRKMLKHFTKHMWLSEASTRAYYNELCEFVEIWNRALDDSLPGRVRAKLQHDETKLYPFYDDLQKNFDRLTTELNKN